MSAPRKGLEVRVVKPIRVEPTIEANIIRDFGSLQKFFDQCVKEKGLGHSNEDLATPHKPAIRKEKVKIS